MTVAELIRELQKLDPTTVVAMASTDVGVMFEVTLLEHTKIVPVIGTPGETRLLEAAGDPEAADCVVLS